MRRGCLHLVIRCEISRSEISDPRSQIWDLGSEISDLRSQIWDLRSEIWDLRFQIWDLRSGILDLRSQMWYFRSEISGKVYLNPYGAFHVQPAAIKQNRHGHIGVRLVRSASGSEFVWFAVDPVRSLSSSELVYFGVRQVRRSPT